MRQILFILFVQISLPCFCQDNGSLVLTINGHVLTSEPDLIAKYPKIKIHTKKDTYENIIGDSIGQFHFSKKINKDIDYIFVIIDGIDNYKQFNEKFQIDTSKQEFIINHNFTLEPEWICIDTWIMPDIIFGENSIEILKSINGNGLVDTLCIDTILSSWRNRWRKEFEKVDWKTKIEIQGYADYNEENSISRMRTDFILKKLINLGIPRKILVISNKNKQTREYFKYRDGCHPYYLVQKQPLKIDKIYIDSINDIKDREQAKQLRRAVTFKWIFNKK
jgi:hypothetical protein